MMIDSVVLFLLLQDIIRLPRPFQFLQGSIAKFISVVRAPKSKEGYAAIGGGSPLRKITDEQADAIQMALQAKNIAANVYVGMRYWYPFTEEAVEQVNFYILMVFSLNLVIIRGSFPVMMKLLMSVSCLRLS